MAHSRAERVAEQIRHELADLIQKKIKDPRVGYVTLTNVIVTSDLGLAKVYVSEFSLAKEFEPGASVKALQHAAGFLRREVGRRMSLRMVPELRFELDTSIERGIRISELLNDVAKSLPEDEDQSGQTPE